MLAKRLEGTNWKLSLDTPSGKLSHSQAERAEFRLKILLHTMDPKLVPGNWSVIPLPKENTPAEIGKLVEAERKKGVSWGVIAERVGPKGMPESKARKAYEEAVALRSKGQRVGKGGRFLDNRPDLYSHDPRNGVAIPTDVRIKDIDGVSESGKLVVSSGKANPPKKAGKKKVATKA
jgi:hypothetical protein